MARGINKVILIGNLGGDPEVRYTPTGTPIANISIATTEGWKDKQSGQIQERTEWHRVVAFNRLAEICGEFLHKGSKVYIEGRLQTRKWQDKNGMDRYTTEIIANDMQMLDSKGGVSGAHYDHHQQQHAGSSDYAQAAPQQAPAMANATASSQEFDDDIPF